MIISAQVSFTQLCSLVSDQCIMCSLVFVFNDDSVNLSNRFRLILVNTCASQISIS